MSSKNFVVAATTLLALWLANAAADAAADRATDGLLAPVLLTINPEARVSVVISSARYQSSRCDAPLNLPVKIVNTASVTPVIEAQLTGLVPKGARVTFSNTRLTGAPEEQRSIQLTVPGRGFVSLTIAFRAKGDITDLGGRDRVHILLNCTQPEA